MIKKRIISRIDIKNEFVIKGIQLEGLRKVGIPNPIAYEYYQQGIDELIFMDAVASYYDRNSLSEIIAVATKNIFVPITVGGGIRKIEDIKVLLDNGADKVAINTAAVKNPDFIKEASGIYGSQCIISSVDVKKNSEGNWNIYYDNGREPTDIDAIEWIKKMEKYGAGEILLTSIDNEGTRKGFEIELCNLVSRKISIPVIASGGAGSISDISDLFLQSEIEAVALGSILHYREYDVSEIKKELIKKNILIR